VRLVKGDDGRDVIQMRVDLGILQLETTGRPDGARPDGHDTLLDQLSAREREEADFELTEEECAEIDREFIQFYHRRMCWLRLQYFRRVVADAEHTLRLMDLCKAHSPDDDWTASHEHYRSFVLYHRTQGEALAELEDSGADEAIMALNKGLERMQKVFVEQEVEEEFSSDEMVSRLQEMRESLRKEYKIGKTLEERLADAVSKEQYELAAKLRDELAKRHAG
jgi:hypothetical protein